MHTAFLGKITQNIKTPCSPYVAMPADLQGFFSVTREQGMKEIRLVSNLNKHSQFNALAVTQARSALTYLSLSLFLPPHSPSSLSVSLLSTSSSLPLFLTNTTWLIKQSMMGTVPVKQGMGTWSFASVTAIMRILGLPSMEALPILRSLWSSEDYL